MTNDDNSQTGLNYELLVEDALRSVVRSSLRIVENIGLLGETHFYISFITSYDGVELEEASACQASRTNDHCDPASICRFTGK